MDLNFLKDVATIFGVIISVLVSLGALIFWGLKNSFKKGELYQLFKSLVDEVSSIKELIDGKFEQNDNKHYAHEKMFSEHGRKIDKLEVLSNVKAYRKAKKIN